MDSRATKLIDMVLKSEGYYSSGKGAMSADAGKETYCGISRVAHPNWSGWKIVDASKPLKYNQKINNQQLDEDIKNFYYQNYYLKMKADKLSSMCIAGHVFCHGVNAGVYTGVKLLQKAINKVCGANIAVDGKIGNITLGYANGDKQDQISQELIKLREQYYMSIVARKPSQRRFLNSWLNRVKHASSVCCKTSANVLIITKPNEEKQNTIWKTILNYIVDFVKQLFRN